MDLVKDTAAIAARGDGKPTKANLFETERFFLDLHLLASGQAQAPHRHEGQDKCLFVLAGRGIVLAGGREHPVGPGQVVFCPAGDEHGVRNDGPEELRLLVFMAPHPKPPR
jgi:quercetin dioxygenase-like cupin family protein